MAKRFRNRLEVGAVLAAATTSGSYTGKANDTFTFTIGEFERPENSPSQIGEVMQEPVGDAILAAATATGTYTGDTDDKWTFTIGEFERPAGTPSNIGDVNASIDTVGLPTIAGPYTGTQDDTFTFTITDLPWNKTVRRPNRSIRPSLALA